MSEAAPFRTVTGGTVRPRETSRPLDAPRRCDEIVFDRYAPDGAGDRRCLIGADTEVAGGRAYCHRHLEYHLPRCVSCQRPLHRLSFGGFCEPCFGIEQRAMWEPPKRRGGRGFIYFVRAEDEPTGLIKIGWAVDVQKRLATLQTGSIHRLEVLASRPGRLEDEKKVHRRFAAHRVRGEWFEPAAEILALVRELADVHSPEAES